MNTAHGEPANPLKPPEKKRKKKKSVWEADCALAGRTLVSGFQLRSPFGRVGRKSRGNKDGVPVCALSPKPAELLSQVCGCSVAGRRKGAPARPSLSNLSAPPGAAPVPPPCPDPCPAAVPSVRLRSRPLPLPVKSGALRGIPDSERLPWPLARPGQAAKASSNAHATAVAPRSIPATIRGPGLAVPSPEGGRA